MRKVLLFFILFISVAWGYKDTIADFDVLKVRDGDTFVINIKGVPDVFGEAIAVRIRGIDTPELKDKRAEVQAIALQAKAELESLLSQGDVVLYNLGRDKYFRLLASVKVGEIDVAEHMLKKGLAKKYNGGKKVW